MHKALHLEKDYWVYGNLMETKNRGWNHDSIFCHASGHTIPIKSSSVCEGTQIVDVDDREIYVGDIIDTGDRKTHVMARSYYVVGSPKGNITMPALLCDLDGLTEYLIIQRSDGTWITENSIKSFKIKVVDNLYGPVEV